MPPKKVAKRQKAKAPMSKQHKDALALGRDQGRAISRYLDALEASRPKRGRKRTAESIKRKLNEVEKKLVGAKGITRLHLVQQQHDLAKELSSHGRTIKIDHLEKEFIAAAKAYSERKGIDYSAWREAGVSAQVLKKAGISRGSREA